MWYREKQRICPAGRSALSKREVSYPGNWEIEQQLAPPIGLYNQDKERKKSKLRGLYRLYSEGVYFSQYCSLLSTCILALTTLSSLLFISDPSNLPLQVRLGMRRPHLLFLSVPSLTLTYLFSHSFNVIPLMRLSFFHFTVSFFSVYQLTITKTNLAFRFSIALF